MERLDGGADVAAWLAQLSAEKRALYDAYWRKKNELVQAQAILNSSINKAGHYDPALSAAQTQERGRPIQEARLYWHKVYRELAALRPAYDQLEREWVAWSFAQPVTYQIGNVRYEYLEWQYQVGIVQDRIPRPEWFPRIPPYDDED